ncbi:AraC family transcriptional regulator [Levilactobacillus cerevisiae]|uniref:AraC family transcriptional regulator n=1 Tax=Levilactobacillus cerevisiae TaxID=1704076 RepID=UPI000F77F334|nr:AraC family transcriptional regulator [Levilactobacillus cerevisiae]
MLTPLFKRENLSDIAIAIDGFVKLTQIPTAFFSLDGTLIKDQTIYSSFQEAITDIKFKQVTLFPAALNYHLFGFAICDTTHVTAARLDLCRSYLEQTMTQALPTAASVSVWASLPPNQTLSLTQLLTQVSHHYFPDTLTTPVAPAVSRPSPTKDIITQTINFVGEHLDEPISLDQAANQVYLSSSYLSRRFKQTLHVNFGDYVLYRKIAQAQAELCLTDADVQQIASNLGFSQTSYFTRAFKRITQVTPSTYRKEKSGVQQVYTVPRPATCDPHATIYDITKQFFDDHQIKFMTQLANGYPFIGAIGNLMNLPHQSGWIYLVDCVQPPTPASEILADTCSVVQWIYTDNIY